MINEKWLEHFKTTKFKTRQEQESFLAGCDYVQGLAFNDTIIISEDRLKAKQKSDLAVKLLQEIQDEYIGRFDSHTMTFYKMVVNTLEKLK